MDTLVECQICGRFNVDTCECQIPGFIDKEGVFFDISKQEVIDYLKNKGYHIFTTKNGFSYVCFDAHATSSELKQKRKQIHLLVNQFSKGKIHTMRYSTADKDRDSDKCYRCNTTLGSNKCEMECCGIRCCCRCDAGCPRKSWKRCHPGYKKVYNAVILFDPLRPRPKISGHEKPRKIKMDVKHNGWLLLMAHKFGPDDCLLKKLPKDVLFLIIAQIDGKQKMHRKPITAPAPNKTVNKEPHALYTQKPNRPNMKYCRAAARQMMGYGSLY